MYPSDDKGKITGRSRGMKSKLDTGAGPNIMSLSTYNSVNPSDIDKDGNPTGNFQRASTGLKSFEGREIQQYGMKTIKVCLGQEAVVIKFSHCRCRRTDPDRVHISCIDTNAIQPSLARQGKKVAEVDVMSKTNDTDSVSE